MRPRSMQWKKPRQPSRTIFHEYQDVLEDLAIEYQEYLAAIHLFITSNLSVEMEGAELSTEEARESIGVAEYGSSDYATAADIYQGDAESLEKMIATWPKLEVMAKSLSKKFTEAANLAKSIAGRPDVRLSPREYEDYLEAERELHYPKPGEE